MTQTSSEDNERTPSDTDGSSDASPGEAATPPDDDEAAEDSTHSPAVRSAVHCGALLLALPLTWLAADEARPLGRAWAAGVCLFGVFFNLFILPRTPLGKAIRRKGEGFISGVCMYPLGLGLAFLLFPPYVVGAAWAAMAVGDAAAVTVGMRISEPRLPWNEKKSWAGLLAFVVAATPSCFALLWWCPSPMFLGDGGSMLWPTIWTISVIAALSGALLESLKGPFDDNLRLPLGVGLTVWLTTLLLHFGTASMPPDRVLRAEWLLHALLINAGLAAAVFIFRFADLAGALGGGIAGSVVYFFALPQGYALLALFVIVGSILSRLGKGIKVSRGAAEARGGRRGLSNVVANLLVPVLCCLAYAASRGHPAALLAFAGALCAAFADTASSELGSLSGRKPRLISTWEEVEHGTDGGVTTLGYVCAALVCVFFSGIAWAVGFWGVVCGGHAKWKLGETGDGLLLSGVVIAAGLLGTTVDSILGARLEGRVPGFTKGTVNFFCTLTGAALAASIGMYLW